MIKWNVDWTHNLWAAVNVTSYDWIVANGHYCILFTDVQLEQSF